MLVYWDSIGEGVRILGNNGGDLLSNDGCALSGSILLIEEQKLGPLH